MSKREIVGVRSLDLYRLQPAQEGLRIALGEGFAIDGAFGNRPLRLFGTVAKAEL
jgi:hypothetical protein